MDVSAFLAIDASSARAFFVPLKDMLNAVRTAPRPTIAGINGACIGAGTVSLRCSAAMGEDDSMVAPFGERRDASRAALFVCGCAGQVEAMRASAQKSRAPEQKWTIMRTYLSP
jgi:1,4-dihydroxy-2-naphthoyl-CoA synthase